MRLSAAATLLSPTIMYATTILLLLPSAAVGFVPQTPPFAAAPPRARTLASSNGSGGSSTTSTSTSLSAINLDPSVPRDVASMDEWAANCGVARTDGFQLTTDDGMDFSVMTTENVPAGTPVVSVPANMILSSKAAAMEIDEVARTMKESQGVDMAEELNVKSPSEVLGRLGCGDQMPQFCLFLKVLMEYERGEESPWFPWLNSLPRVYYNAVSMTDFCYECLPPLVFALTKAERIIFNNFDTAVANVNFLSDRTKRDVDLLKWAFNVVYTRCWSTESGEKQIVPMADMFNHGTETEIEYQYDEEGNCYMVTNQDVPAGSPLRMSYGDPTNPSFLFARYGFLDETSPATFCKIILQPTQQLLDLGYDYSRMLFYKDTGDISEEVWDIMLYQVLATNRDVQQAFYNAHMNGDVDTKQQIHQQYFFETSSKLKKHVDTLLKLLDELSAKGVGKNVDQHPRLPLILRHNEFFKETFLMVKDRLDPMVAEAAEMAGEPMPV